MAEPTAYRTAYEEMIASQAAPASEGETPSSKQLFMPSYMTSANTLSIANKDQSFADSAAETIQDIPNFIRAAAISGVHQLYNAPKEIGNLFGAEYEITNTADVISAMDSDLGSFYKEHKEGADMVGFIASSMVPGLGGIKIMNAGQSSLRAALVANKFGTHTAKALRLLVPDKERWIARAVEQVAKSSSAPVLANKNTIRAMMAGAGQQVLEATAFEVAVAATLFNSPVLENQDFGDLMSNVAWGGVVFGGVGGVVSGAGAYFKVKGAAKTADRAAMPWRHIEDYEKGTQSYEKVALDFDQMHSIPKIPSEAAVGAERVTYLKQSAISKVETLNLRIRTEIGTMAGGDQVAAQTMYDTAKGISKQKQLGVFIGAKEVSRVGTLTKVEKEIARINTKVAKGNATADEASKLADLQVGFIRSFGDDAGRTSSDLGAVTHLADTLEKGESISVVKNTVRAGKRKWEFTVDHTKSRYDILGSEPLETQARHYWAAHSPKLTPTKAKPVVIDINDIPLFEKAARELGDEDLINFKVKTQSGELAEFPNVSNMKQVLEASKSEVAGKLQDATARGSIGSDPKVVVAKLRSILGLDFVTENLESGIIAHFSRPTGGGGAGLGKIVLNKKFITRKPLHELVSTLLHEEGHRKFDVLLDIGGVPASSRTALHKELIAVSKVRRAKAWKNLETYKANGDTAKVAEWSEYLNEEHELMADAFSYFTQFPKKMANEAPTFKQLFGDIVRPLPEDVVNSYMVRAKQLTQDEIASMVNVRPKYLSGEHAIGGGEVDDLYALQSYAKEYSSRLRKQGSLSATADDVDIFNIPQHVKVAYDTKPFAGVDGNLLENMVIIKGQQRLYTQGVHNAVASTLGTDYAKLDVITSDMVRDSANRIGSGSKLYSAASSNYGSLAATTEHLGNVTTGIIEKFQKATREAIEPALYKLGQNQAAAVEWATINATLRSIPDRYVLDSAGKFLEPAVIARWKQKVKAVRALNEMKLAKNKAAGKAPPKKLKQEPARPVLQTEGAPEVIPFKHPESLDLAKLHIERNGKRVDSLRGVRNAQGATDTREAGVFYPTPVDPKDYPFFALVSDESITGQGMGHTKTLYATTEKELAAQISKVKENPHLRVRTKGEAERYYKSIGQWDVEKTLSDNYLDNAMHRKGVSAPHFVPTEPKKIIDDLLNWHMQRESGLVRETIAANYEVPFKELKTLGEKYTDIATSKFSNTSLLKYADEVVENPYGSYIKTALGLKNYADYPWWVATNRMADDAVSKVYNRIAGAVETAKTPKELAAVNSMLEQSGYKGAAYDESMELFANSNVSKGILTAAVQKANSILATITLRLDFLNAANNAISANVLLGAETKAVIRAIEASDTNAVGQLAKLGKITVPGTNKMILSPSKLIANSMKRFGKDTPEMAFYRDNRFITSISDQYRWTLESMTYNGKESVQAWSGRVDDVHSALRNAANTGEKWTGNKLAEEFNRFVAADVMKQITDVAVKNKIMTGKQQLAYINTFVNRTQGNYLAAQRPMAFAGPIGQAIGLFQTYQFNLMQQLLRHVGEGASKDAMTLLALQGTIHGLNGLPAFNAVNTHILGNASGNQEHRDVYDTTYGILGKQAGDWLMFGVASNMLIHPDLKVNLYTRGDINPRHVTILPSSPADVPIIGASTKFFSNLFETAGKLKAGGDVATTLLQGLEHNGISRPLAGLAQTLEAAANPLGQSYSTSNRGNVIASNDLLSIANLGRMAGGKPLDEAIAIDATFRLTSYGLKDSRKRQALGEAIKTTLIAGQDPTQEQIEGFAESYAATGGKQEQFNSWMGNLYKTANVSQANKIQDGLGSNFSQNMQEIMGGYRLKDFEGL